MTERSRLRRALAVIWAYVRQPAEPEQVSSRRRLIVALIIGVVATLFAYHQLTDRGLLASDFEYDLRAARRLLAGLDPYNDPSVGVGLPYPFDAQFPYPIFAALFAVPFTVFTSYAAGALYVGLISGVMAYAVTRGGWWRLVIFLSPCYFVAASVANWSPLLIASAFLPLLYPLAIVKPTLAAPIMANYPSAVGYLLSLALVVLSLLLFPAWPVLWLGSVAEQAGKYTLPVLMGPTILVLFAAVWWRKRAARLLVMFACVPQHPFFYDQLVLWLLPRTLRQSLALSLAGWLAYLSWSLLDPSFEPLLAKTPHGPGLNWTAPLFYLPALILVVWQQISEAGRRRRALTEAGSDRTVAAS